MIKQSSSNGKIIRKFAVAMSLVSITSCGGNNWEKEVQSHIFKNYDQIKTVGEALNNWQACGSVDWHTITDNDNYGEVRYTCALNGVESLTDALIKNQEKLLKENEFKSREISQELADNIGELQMNICETELYVSKVERGAVTIDEDAVFTREELLEDFRNYLNVLKDVSTKTIANTFNKESELATYTTELQSILAKYEYKAYAKSFYHPAIGFKEFNGDERFSELHDDLLSCISKIEWGTQKSKNFHNRLTDERYPPRSDLSLSYIIRTQETLLQLSKKADYSKLSGVGVEIKFKANQKNSQVDYALINWTIGDEVKQTEFSKSTIFPLIYADVDLTQKLAEERELQKISELF